MKQKYYYKATKDNGISNYDPDFRYKLGHNKHPKPDFSTSAACGVGIHLGKTILSALSYVTGATEVYKAIPDDILGEDETKIRCSGCTLVSKLNPKVIGKLKRDEETAIRFKRDLDKLPKNILFDEKWIIKSLQKVTLLDFMAQSLNIRSNGKKVTIRPTMQKKDIRFVLKSMS